MFEVFRVAEGFVVRLLAGELVDFGFESGPDVEAVGEDVEGVAEETGGRVSSGEQDVLRLVS